MLKSTLINAIAAKNNYASYLEISTPTTGQQFDLIDRKILPICELAIYNLGDAKIDRCTADYATSENSSRVILENIYKTYDLIFVDPYHTYLNSIDDMIGAFSLLRPGGALVVHDCNPETKELASPDFKEGAWCGVTYWAYIDFVLKTEGVDYFTVDTDYGCGIIIKRGSATSYETAELYCDWFKLSQDSDTRYELFNRNRQELLHLVSVEQFSLMMGIVGEAPANNTGAAYHGWPWNYDDSWL